MLTFNKNYFAIAFLIFVIEVIIALFVHDVFVRPYLGDILVVILIYCFIKSFLRLPVITAAVIVLIFAFSIEFLQYVNIVNTLHLENSKIARTIIGTSFSWIDLLMYVIGLVIVIVIEKYWFKNELRTIS
ncbi:DUF2809 domain-containing protein [Flavobacterium sp. K5-23]|uniref:ribosomal maturation YjgA family protein n=1 Tax=Flavobacterium sp. K5-23 TaxID=2746225 RepID=UPI00200FCF8A|nr:DUF2809 domain-containing protein [Flavobacterium sp. K5-23]UQD56853.1 DUF2809 domain-containing protein [Flavobacterium sp. K5-23]